MKFRDVYRHTHTFTAGEEVAVKSLWVDSCAALLRVLTPALILQLFTVTVQRWPTTFLLEAISPLLCGLCHQDQTPLIAWMNSLELLWDGNSLLHPWMPQEILNSPNRKGKSCHQSTSTACHKNQHRPTRPWLPAQFLSWGVSHLLSPPEPGPQYFQGQKVLLEDNIQQVLLEGTVLWCFCRDLSVAAAAKLTEAAQPALGLRLSSPEVSGKEKRVAFATWALLHHCPAPSRVKDVSVIWAPPDPTDGTFPDTQSVSSSYCLLPPISNTTDCPCQQLQPFTTVCSVSRKIQKPDQCLLLQITCGKISVPYTQCIPNTKENAFQVLILILPCLEKKEASGICASIIFHIESEARLS